MAPLIKTRLTSAAQPLALMKLAASGKSMSLLPRVVLPAPNWKLKDSANTPTMVLVLSIYYGWTNKEIEMVSREDSLQMVFNFNQMIIIMIMKNVMGVNIFLKFQMGKRMLLWGNRNGWMRININYLLWRIIEQIRKHEKA